MRYFRPSTAALAVAALVLSVAPANLVLASASAASTAPEQSVTSPTLPAPPVAAIVMSCHPGQTDLNTATADELATAMSLSEDELQIADNIVAYRGATGYNGLLDLLQYGTGVGPGLLSHVDPAKFCVTPIGGLDAVVASIPDTACPLDGSKVDINTATADEIEPVLPGSPRVTRPTAERIAARAADLPFPSLNALTAVPGVGPGTLNKIRSSLCLTPSPVTATSSDGLPQIAALISRDQPVEISLDTSRGTFRLGVPDSTITTDHAWATITQTVPHRDLGVPVADMHINNDWADGTKHVWATVPADTFQAAGFTQALVHMPSDGSPNQFFYGDNVAVSSDGTELTAPLDSLSSVQGLAVPDVSFLFQNDPGLSAKPVQPTGPGNSVTPADIARFIAQILDYRSSRPSCPSDSVNYTYSADLTGFYVDNGEILTCHWVDGTDGKLRVKAVNNKSFIAEMSVNSAFSTGAGGNFDSNLVGPPSTPVGDAFQTVLNALLGGTGLHYIAPGGTAGFDVKPASGSIQPDYGPALEPTFGYVISNYLVGELVEKNPTAAVLDSAIECFYPAVTSDGFRNGMSNTEAFSSVWSCLEANVGPALKAFGKDAAALVFSRVLMYADVGAPLLDYVDYEVQSIVALFTHNVPIKISYAVNSSPGSVPITDVYGRTVVQSCITGGQFDPRNGFVPFSYDLGCQNAHYGGAPDTGGGGNQPNGQGGIRIQAQDQADGTIASAPDTMGAVLIRGQSGVQDGLLYRDGTYGAIYNRSYLDCLSLTQGYPIRWNMPQSVLDSWTTSTAPYAGYGGGDCATPAATWIASTLTNYILRNPNNGQSWFLDGAGTIHDIQDGGTFLCLANKYLVRETTDPTGHVENSYSFVYYPQGPPATCP